MSFLSFFKAKTISNRQALAIGFVLAVLALSVLAVSVFILPQVGFWMNARGVVELDFFYMAFLFIFTCSLEALILFGFPLYYATDAKNHMSAFRILLCTLLWMLGLMGFMVVLFAKMYGMDMESYMLDEFPGVTQDEPAVELYPSPEPAPIEE